MFGQNQIDKQAQDITSKLFKLANSEVLKFKREETALVRNGANKDSLQEVFGYKKINSPYPGIHQYEKKDQNGRVQQIWFDARYNVTTFQLQGTQADKSAGIVGTDGKAVVKLLGKQAYDYLKVDDFIDRANLIVDAALDLAQDYSAGAKESLISYLGQYRQTLLQQIIAKSNFNGIKDDVRDNDKVFSSKYKNAHEILQQGLSNVAGFLQVLSTNEGDPLSHKEAVERIKQAEISHVTERGRPIIIKVGQVGQKGTNQFLSAQIPLGKKTIPSSDRSGHHDIKLSNHVRDITGVVDSNNTVKVLSTVDGHSSYPSIEEKDEIKRRLVAYQAAHEKVKQVAEDIVASSSNLDLSEPIDISLSTMMMLTPAIGKKVESAGRGAESEHNQLSDTRYALDMLANSKQPMEITLDDGQKILVNVDINYMNYPVNVGKKMQKMLGDPLQKTINTRGFIKFKDQFSKHIDNFVKKNPSVAVMKNFKMYLDNTGMTVKDASAVNTKRRQLEVNIEGLKEEVGKSYQKLAKLFQTYNIENPDKSQLKTLKNKYDSERKKIQKIEAKIDKQFEKIEAIEKKFYSQKQGHDFQAGLRKDLTNLLQSDQVKSDPSLQKIVTASLHYLKAEQLYQEKGFMEKTKAYQFHVNFLLANQGLGRLTEAFCKSAEDRTGWLRVSLMAQQAFIAENNRLPNLDDPLERKMYNNFYSSAVLELSASIENTKYNSEARSLQVSGDFTNEDYNIDSGKKVAQIAKAIFKDLPKPNIQYSMQPSSERKQIPSQVIPSQIAKEDLLPTNSRLLPEDQINAIRKYIQSNGLSGPLRLSKMELAKALDVDNFPYSVVLLPGQKQDYLCAIYHGAKQKKHIATGSYGTVKLAQDLESGKFYALKTQKHLTDKQKKDQSHEMKMLTQVGQAVGNVVYKTKSDNLERNAFVMELAPGEQPSLDVSKKLNFSELAEMMENAVDAVQKVHQRGVVHRDIKPANMHRDKDGSIRVVDFGTADALNDKGEVAGTLQGTPIYMSPRLLDHFALIVKKNSKLKAYDKQIEASDKMMRMESDPLKQYEFVLKLEELEKEKKLMLAERNSLNKKQFTYTPADDVYSLGVSLAVLTGLAKTVLPKDKSDVVVRFAIDDKTNTLNLPKDLKDSLVEVIKNMTAEPPKVSLDQVNKHIQQVFSSATLDSKLTNKAAPQIESPKPFKI